MYSKKATKIDEILTVDLTLYHVKDVNAKLKDLWIIICKQNSLFDRN